MPVQDKNATTITLNDVLKFPISSDEVEQSYGRLIGVSTDASANVILHIAYNGLVFDVAPAKTEVLTKFATAAVGDIATREYDADEIVARLA